MKPGDRVIEGERTGALVRIYELRTIEGVPLGRKSAEVQFDGDRLPTAGVWLDRLTAAPNVTR